MMAVSRSTYLTDSPARLGSVSSLVTAHLKSPYRVHLLRRSSTSCTLRDTNVGMCFTELLYAAEARTFFTKAVLTLELLEDSRAQRRKISLRLMPLGGSVTYGQGSTDGNGYRNYLRQLLVLNGCEVDMVGSRKAGSMEDNDNEGWRGYRIDQILAKAEKYASAHMPNIFTVNAGSNDCIQDFEIDGAGGRINHMLEALWMRCPAATIILSTLLMTAQDNTEQRVLRVNSQLESLVEKQLSGQRKIVLVDMHGAKGPQLCDLVDGVHPNDHGYKKMAQIWYQGIQEAIHKGFL